MKERPILFSAPMVRAILAGTKTQTRRVAKGVHIVHANTGEALARLDSSGPRIPCPFGQPGDRLWVRETHAPQADCWGSWERWTRGEGGQALIIHYAADAEPAPFIERWRPSIHMPRWASRIALEITAVRVERLQAISVEDAEDEGCKAPDELVMQLGCRASPTVFRQLWEQINGAGSWDANPWVWAITFKRVHT